MEHEDFEIYQIFPSGEIAGSVGCSPMPALAIADAEDLRARLNVGRRCEVLESRWDSHFPGVGRIFLVGRHELRTRLPDPGQGASPFAHVVRFSQAGWDRSLDALALAYGLTATEREIAGILAASGGAGFFDRATGSGSARARNALARLRRKFGTPNLAGTVSHILELMYDPAPAGSVSVADEDLALLFDLSPRQARVASLVMRGAARPAVARATGNSLAVVKAELGYVYEILGVESAAELSAIFGQARLLAEGVFSLETRTARHEDWGRHQVSKAPGGRKIGYSLYGRTGDPLVHITHSNATCRHPPTRLVARLVAGGRQVLTIDRPGFGDTSPPPSPTMEMQVACAISDLEQVLQAEGLDRFALLARSSCEIALEYCRSIPARIERVVLINPVPPCAISQTERGPLGAIKRRFIRSPGAIRLLIGTLLQLGTPHRIRAAAERSMAQSPPDAAALRDPLVLDDYLAANLPLKQSLDGYVLEVSSWARGWHPKPVCDGKGWEVFIGGHFVLHDPRTTAEFIRQILPKASIRMVKDAGTLLAWSHPEVIANALTRG